MRKVLKGDKTLARPEPREHALEEDEIRVLWKATEGRGAYGAAVRMALLTAQRFIKVAHMRRGDIHDNVWDASRPDDPKNKKVFPVWLSRFAQQIIAAVPEVDPGYVHHTDYIFSNDGIKPMRGWSKLKERLDADMLKIMREEVEACGGDPRHVNLRPWQHRDLRRTARTIFSEHLKLSTQIAEHWLGHVMPRIERTYNRYKYTDEKRQAFEALSNFVEALVTPAPSAPRTPSLHLVA